MRLFLALELDESVRAAVVSLQRRLLGALGPDRSVLRMVCSEQLHLTLVFLGEVSEDRARSLMDVLDRPLTSTPYTLAFGGIGMFPPHGAPRVLWLGVVGGAAATIAVRAAVLARLAEAGSGARSDDRQDPHDQVFTPHLTLGRWRNGRPHHRRALAGIDASATAAVASTRVDAVTLFQSRLSSAGASHSALARTRLGGV